MCTVTFIPTQTGFVFTSNRDESINRKTSLLPKFEQINNQNVLFPKDGEAGGTWIACSENGRIVCLLNGAFKNHKHTPPYRKSRGLVVLDVFNFENIKEFVAEYDLINIEPFTLIVIENYKFYEFRWDGEKKHLKFLNWKDKHIWSSSTLYSNEIQEKRAEIFKKSVLNTKDDILKFHSSIFSLGNENGFLLKRENGVETISHTQIVCARNEYTMYHNNRITNTEYYNKVICESFANVE